VGREGQLFVESKRPQECQGLEQKWIKGQKKGKEENIHMAGQKKLEWRIPQCGRLTNMDNLKTHC
jgi:hypothetical protein